MAMNNAVLVMAVLLLAGFALGKDCPGEGWAFQGKKCFKIFPDLFTQEEGVALCQSEFINGMDVGPPRLLQVFDNNEQNYILDTVFDNTTMTPGVWLGARRDPISGEFLWSGQRKFGFSRWAVDNPTNNPARACVEMQSELSIRNDLQNITKGDWHDVTCLKGNWVVCEKYPRWSVLDMIDAIVDLQYEVEKINP